MRAIDGDALRDRLQNLGYDDWNQGAITTWAKAFNECADMVADAPTIEPQSKKGKWIEEPNCYYRCSECGKHYPSILGYMNYNYCPNCGARMEGQE